MEGVSAFHALLDLAARKAELEKQLDDIKEQIAVAPEGAGRKLMFFPKQVKLFADGAIISQLMQMKDGYTDGHHGAWIIDPPMFDKASRPSGTPATRSMCTTTATWAPRS